MPKRVHNQQKGGEKASRKCPDCHSEKNWKDGIRKTRNGPVQRYICRDCGYRFSESSVLSMNLNNSGRRRVCAILTEAKNLTTVEPQKAGLAGATRNIKGKIIEFSFWLKKEGYKDSTIHMRSRTLKRLVKLGADLYDPENVKEIIAKKTSWCINTKASVVDSYGSFLVMNGIRWNLPRYKEEKPLPFLPTESEIDALIAGCGKKTATFLQLLKETGMRAGEACSIEWTDVDTERRLIHLRKAEKRIMNQLLTGY